MCPEEMKPANPVLPLREGFLLDENPTNADVMEAIKAQIRSSKFQPVSVWYNGKTYYASNPEDVKELKEIYNIEMLDKSP